MTIKNKDKKRDKKRREITQIMEKKIICCIFSWFQESKQKLLSVCIPQIFVIGQIKNHLYKRIKK
jgi:hypothetical protein